MNDSLSKKGISLIEDYRGNLVYFIEGENALDQTGGGIGRQNNASNNLCLGKQWGDNDDYAVYGFNLSKPFKRIQLKIRYSDMFDRPTQGPNNANNLSVYLDNRNVGTLFTDDTGDWNTFNWSNSLYLGDISEGSHELKLVSKDNRYLNCVNLDCLKLFFE